MKLTLTIESQDPTELARVALALGGANLATPEGDKPPKAPRPTPIPTPATREEKPTRAGAAPTEAAVPTEDQLTTAANSAVAKLGTGGPAQIKAFISAKFTKADGAPGGLKSTAEPQRGALLAALNEIVRTGTVPAV